ncbi:DUF6511 domain-containing protein [Cupriavidus gilardii]
MLIDVVVTAYQEHMLVEHERMPLQPALPPPARRRRRG